MDAKRASYAARKAELLSGLSGYAANDDPATGGGGAGARPAAPLPPLPPASAWPLPPPRRPARAAAPAATMAAAGAQDAHGALGPAAARGGGGGGSGAVAVVATTTLPPAAKAAAREFGALPGRGARGSGDAAAAVRDLALPLRARLDAARGAFGRHHAAAKEAAALGQRGSGTAAGSDEEEYGRAVRHAERGNGEGEVLLPVVPRRIFDNFAAEKAAKRLKVKGDLELERQAAADAAAFEAEARAEAAAAEAEAAPRPPPSVHGLSPSEVAAVHAAARRAEAKVRDTVHAVQHGLVPVEPPVAAVASATAGDQASGEAGSGVEVAAVAAPSSGGSGNSGSSGGSIAEAFTRAQALRRQGKHQARLNRKQQLEQQKQQEEEEEEEEEAGKGGGATRGAAAPPPPSLEADGAAAAAEPATGAALPKCSAVRRGVCGAVDCGAQTCACAGCPLNFLDHCCEAAPGRNGGGGGALRPKSGPRTGLRPAA